MPDSTSEAITGSSPWQSALLGLARHPGGDLLRRRVIARVLPDVGDVDGCPGCRLLLLLDRADEAQRVGGLAGACRHGLRLHRCERQRVARPALGRRRPGGRAWRLCAGGQIGGRPEVRGDGLVEAHVQVILVAGVGEVARPGDRPRRPDLRRPDRGIEILEGHRDLACVEVGRVDRDAVDRRDVEAAAEVMVGHRSAARELRVVRAHTRDGDLVVLAELGQHRHDPRIDPPLLQIGDADLVEHDVVVLQQRLRLRARRAALALRTELGWIHGSGGHGRRRRVGLGSVGRLRARLGRRLGVRRRRLRWWRLRRCCLRRLLRLRRGLGRRPPAGPPPPLRARPPAAPPPPAPQPRPGRSSAATLQAHRRRPGAARGSARRRPRPGCPRDAGGRSRRTR